MMHPAVKKMTLVWLLAPALKISQEMAVRWLWITVKRRDSVNMEGTVNPVWMDLRVFAYQISQEAGVRTVLMTAQGLPVRMMELV